MIEVNYVSWRLLDLTYNHAAKAVVPLSEDRCSAVPTTSVRHLNHEGRGGEWRKEEPSIRR